jgi:tyrosine-protein kinase Etk/Wzc
LELSANEIEALRKERNQIVSQVVRSVSLSSPNDELSSSYSGMTLLNLEKELEAALVEEERYKNQVNFYKIQIDRFTAEHPDISKDILEYAGLVRARDVLKSTIDILLEKREEARIRVASEQGGVKVIDKPRLPERPVPRKKALKLIVGIIAALGLGVVVCVIIDRFDDSIKDESQIQQMGLPVFGTIPVIQQSKSAAETILQGIKRNGDSGKEEIRLLTAFSEKSPVAEAYRSLKTSLSFIATDKSKKIFVISSPSSAEGKSLTTANIAISFAQGGTNTLILDCDLRRATQHKYFELERKPGLTNYLFNEVQLSDIVKKTPISNLHIITAGSSPPNPAELAASGRMAAFLKEIRSKFDIILVDTPPIMACVDSRILAGRGDGMIMIAKVESTSYKAILHAVNLSQRLNVELLGIILNQTEMRYGYGYYYAYRYYNPYSYYYSGYSYYYQEDEKTGERMKKRRKLDTQK